MPDGSGSVVDPYPATNGVGGELLEPVGQRRISAFDTGDIERVLFAHQGVRASLAVGSQVDMFQLIASEALVFTSKRVLEDGEGRRGRLFMCTSLGADPVAALTELL